MTARHWRKNKRAHNRANGTGSSIGFGLWGNQGNQVSRYAAEQAPLMANKSATPAYRTATGMCIGFIECVKANELFTTTNLR